MLRTPDSITDVCIADFGYARLLGGMTRAKSRVGTAEYCAPEVISGYDYHMKVDEWSLGVITCTCMWLCAVQLTFVCWQIAYYVDIRLFTAKLNLRPWKMVRCVFACHVC